MSPAAGPDAPTADATATAARASRAPLLGGVSIGGVVLLVAAAVALGGDRQPEPSTVVATGGGQQTVEVALVDMAIVPGEITVDPNTHLILTVTNNGGMRHDLAFPDGPTTQATGIIAVTG